MRERDGDRDGDQGNNASSGFYGDSGRRKDKETGKKDEQISPRTYTQF
jgi:hypothetical protein